MGKYENYVNQVQSYTQVNGQNDFYKTLLNSTAVFNLRVGLYCMSKMKSLCKGVRYH